MRENIKFVTVEGKLALMMMRNITARREAKLRVKFNNVQCPNTKAKI